MTFVNKVVVSTSIIYFKEIEVSFKMRLIYSELLPNMLTPQEQTLKEQHLVETRTQTRVQVVLTITTSMISLLTKIILSTLTTYEDYLMVVAARIKK